MMDKDRQFRLLIPPFFLIASVVWEAYLSGQLSQYSRANCSTDLEALKTVISVLGIVGVATLPVGFAIGVLTMSVLRRIPGFPNQTYEVPMSKDAMDKIRDLLEIPQESHESPLSIAAVFDHALLKSSVHEWLFRRWSTFNICTQCTMALLLSYVLGHALHVQVGWKWAVTVLSLIALFTCQAVRSWNESYDMFELVTEGDRFLRKRRTTV